MADLALLDDIARDAWEGNYERVGVLSKGERLYVALLGECANSPR